MTKEKEIGKEKELAKKADVQYNIYNQLQNERIMLLKQLPLKPQEELRALTFKKNKALSNLKEQKKQILFDFREESRASRLERRKQINSSKELRENKLKMRKAWTLYTSFWNEIHSQREKKLVNLK